MNESTRKFSKEPKYDCELGMKLAGMTEDELSMNLGVPDGPFSESLRWY